jgi:hypothetical protein
MAVTGNVNTQVQIIRSTMPHLTALNRLVVFGGQSSATP